MKKVTSKKDYTGLKIGKLTVLNYSHFETTENNWGKIHFWNVICDCGKKLKVRQSDIGRTKNGRKSCGCLKGRKHFDKILPEDQQLPWSGYNFLDVYAKFKAKSSKYGFEFNLSRIELFNIVNKPCIYCGIEWSAVMKPRKNGGKQKEFRYNGIDRIDPNKGYVKGNSAPCCANCNYAKHTLGILEFENFIKRLYNNLWNNRKSFKKNLNLYLQNIN